MNRFAFGLLGGLPSMNRFAFGPLGIEPSLPAPKAGVLPVYYGPSSLAEASYDGCSPLLAEESLSNLPYKSENNVLPVLYPSPFKVKIQKDTGNVYTPLHFISDFFLQ